jgi:hypothetical protein
MSNISLTKYCQLVHEPQDHEGYKLLSENKETAFSLCVECLEMNFFNIQDKTFNCVKCNKEQSC